MGCINNNASSPIRSHDHDDDDDDDDDSIMGPSFFASLRGGSCDKKDKESNNKASSIIRGECIICFEHFEAGDTIVYNINNTNTNNFISNNNNNESSLLTTDEYSCYSCLHVYHKNCMVTYLANRKISKTGLRNGQGDCPTCPICRQQYCRLVLPLPLSLTLSLTMPITSTSGISSINNNNNNNDNENNEELIIADNSGDGN